ncbi:PduM family microcompartment protein [Lentilactobacillus raoultii]|uniref:PduM family microcompartment protein n=1 Tax=Lentilactobacillus raoultii TaxID=1987503 RepID=A0ABW3PDC7_9LACO|nr:PduM family microcompartment protein [Lentilactobacillus raoultii]
MDWIVEEVLKKIEERKHNSQVVSYSEQEQVPNEKLFIDFGEIQLNGMTISLLIDLYQVNKHNQWVSWILKGISYNVKFFFQINENMLNFVPLTMLHDWPVTFIVGDHSPVFTLYQRNIGRSDIARFADYSILIMTTTQKLTSEALEVIEQKHIIKKVRTDEDCIWQK